MSQNNFYGKKSSELAKAAYVPVRDFINTDQINITLGVNTSIIFLTDPKLILFTLAKYKFAGKVLNGRNNVLEIGCMEGLGSILLASFVKKLTSIDFYRPHIDQALMYAAKVTKNIDFIGMDFLDSEYVDSFDGCVCFDVLEHLDPNQETEFVKNIYKSLNEGGLAVIGYPSIESQKYASEVNKHAHINCKNQIDGKNFLLKFFKTVIPFSMNDEIVHTGYAPMSHYLLFLCIK